MNKPFRWDISKREQLGRLIRGSGAEFYPEFVDDLRRCCSRIISFCDYSDLIFVGRSPESIFDYLSGLLSKTSWSDRCMLLNFSMRYQSLQEVRGEYPKAISNFYAQMRSADLSPRKIIPRSRRVAFVDLVSSGGTLGNLTDILLNWTREEKLDEPALKRKLRYVGITWQTKTSPNTWRWHQHVEWVQAFRARAIKNVSIPGRLWNYLGNTQKKVTLSNPPWRWGDEEFEKPPRYKDNLEALRLALYLFDLGNSRDHRIEFAQQLSGEVGMKYPWFRSLVSEVRDAG